MLLSLTLLEFQRYLVLPTRRWFAGGVACQIYDGESGEAIGMLEENIGWASRFMRYALSRRLARSQFDVRETLDESLLFSIVKPRGLFAQRYEVVDSQEDFIGSIGNRKLWDVRDEHGTTIAHASDAIDKREYRIVSTEGNLTLAEVQRNGPLPKPLKKVPGHFAITLADDFDESPFAKMLILGIIFLIELSNLPRRR